MGEKKSRRGIGGRPSSATHPVVAVTHLDTGHSVAWSDGVFAGDPELVDAARIAAAAHVPVRVGPRGRLATTGDDTPLAAAVSMLDACGGRGVIDTPTDPEQIPGWEPDTGCIPLDEPRDS